MHFVSKTCAGAHCACGQPATHKIGEESYPDHPGAHPDPLVNAAELAVIRSLPPELGFTAGLTAYVCCEHFLQLMGPSAPCPVSDVVASKRDRVAELSDELAEVRADSADLIKRRDELLALVAKLSQTVPLESEVGEALEQRGVLLAEIGTLRSEVGELRENLRVAEAVRDDARAASQRYLEEKRTAEEAMFPPWWARSGVPSAYFEPSTYVRMASDRLEAVAKSELRILAEFAAQEIKERDDKLVAIAAVLQGDHDDASAMVDEIRKIVGERRVHMECVNMPGGTGPCACLDGCGSCDSCGRWMGEACPHPAACADALARGADPCDAVHSFKVEPYQSYPVWARPGASSTEIRDSIIDAVGIEGWKKGVLESIDKLTAFQMNGNSLTYEKALELLNTLYHHPPTFSTTVITREQLVQDKVYETWVPTAADGAIIGEPLAMRLPVVDPSRAPEVIEKPRAEGDHYFEDWCNACGAGQPSGECSVCPHLPVGYGPGGYGAIDTKAEHYARRPCRGCGSTDLRSVRVRGSTK